MNEIGLQGVLGVAKEIGSGVYSLFSTGFELTPYLGSMIQTVKFNLLITINKSMFLTLLFNNMLIYLS
ncbi:hypothetical protein ACT1UG_21940 [Bacillus paramycoides]|uniref:hypothetical protein n=1 Tax=Bacillus paramycoides TaxID=2026194 RepID=UPI00405812A2